MTQVVSNQIRRTSDRIGFSTKSLDGIAADFRAIAGALGRPDIIAAFNGHPVMKSRSYKRRRGFLARVIHILRNNPDDALSYLQQRRPRSSHHRVTLPDQWSRVRSKAKGRLDKESPHIAKALALDDPCKDLDEQ